jgi:hypothetical protein
LSILAQFGKVVALALIYLVAFDVVGVIVSLVLDVVPVRGKSGLLFYTIWSVLGVFCGMITYNGAGDAVCEAGAGDWTSRPDASRAGRVVLVALTFLFAAIGIASYFIWWQRGVEWMYFVPDNMSLTMVFFGTIVASAIFAHTVLRPTTK